MKTLFALVLAVFAFAYSELSLAGYAQLKPPPGWSQGLGAAVPGQAGVFSFGMAANGANFRGGTVLTNAALNVAGQLVTVPVSMRMAANAATVAAEWSFGNPLLFAAALAAPFAYAWFKENGLEVKNGIWVKGDPAKLWGITNTSFQYSTSDGACNAVKPVNTGLNVYTFLSLSDDGSSYTCIYNRTYNGSPSGVVSRTIYKAPVGYTPPGDPVFTPIGLPAFKQIMAPKPLPVQVPEELPDVSWPVGDPVINPDPAIDPLPAPSPVAVPRPLWVPTGDPAKNPNSDPASKPDTWTQPGVRVTPSPTPADPWRVDVTPEDKTKEDPSPNVEEDPVETVTNPEPEPSEPLCELFPDILACAKLGTPGAPETVKNTNKPMTITKDAGWGPENGACPAPRVINLHFGSVNLPWTSICGLASGMRPFFVAFAYLGAALSFFGIGRKA